MDVKPRYKTRRDDVHIVSTIVQFEKPFMNVFSSMHILHQER